MTTLERNQKEYIMELMTAHDQWKTRPTDQRFPSLSALKTFVAGRRQRARDVVLPLTDLRFMAPHDTALTVGVTHDETVPSNWAFGQLAQQLKAPAGYLRTLPAPLAIQCLQNGVGSARTGEATRLLLETEDAGEVTTLRAATSLTYGRIWDSDVVAMVEQIVQYTDGRFFNPKEWSGTPSGLYASDRDVFLFLIDGGSIVDGGGERDQLHRGFFTWNSEVGSATFGLTTFLFRQVCGNHIIWGAEDVKTVKIRHTGQAPGRFAHEVQPALLSYVNASAKQTEATIKHAKAFLLPEKREERVTWLMEKGFTKAEALGGIAAAEREEGEGRTVWQIVNGLTAYAREYAYLDARLDLERRAGKLMQLVG
jgi:hypothetical protein